MVLIALALAVSPMATFPGPRAKGDAIDVVHVQGAMVADTTWTSDHVYVVDDNLTVTRGVVLRIEAGTIVKFAQYANLFVEGALQVNEPPIFFYLYLPCLLKGFASGVGTLSTLPATMLQPTIPSPGGRVYFTSLKDDSLGGDTNDDEDATMPAQGDWGGIVFEDSSKDHLCYMRAFAIRYSGVPRSGQLAGAILLRNASPYLRDAEFLDNYLNGIETKRSDWLTDYWDVQGIAYHVTGDLTIPRANTLGIAPGVVVKFGEWRRLKVKGTLWAIGTGSHPVILTSIKDDAALGDTNGDAGTSTPRARDWGGILFDEESCANPGMVAWAELRYTGTATMPYVAAIELDNCSPALDHITFVDNYLNGAQLVASRDQLETLTLSSTSVPYCILTDLEVKRNETLTIDPGVTLKLKLNSSLHVLGVLHAVGTRQQPIVVTSLKNDDAINDTNNDGALTTPERGNWGCVFFDAQTDDTRNIMDWVHLSYGGRDSLEFSSRAGAIRLDNASPTLRNITFENNWINAVEIPKGDWESDVWDNVDVVYFVSGDLRIPQGETLTVAPGVVVKVVNRTTHTNPPEIVVEGALQVGDLTGSPVVFTSGRDDEVGPANRSNKDSNGDGTETAPEVHDWIGITFDSAADTENSYIRNALFKYGGTRAGTFQDPQGVLRLRGGSVPIDQCEFTQNYRAIEAMGGALPVISMSSLEGNEDYAVYNDTPLTTTVQALNNWWGAANGPRSDGEPCNTAPGDGDMVSCGVAFDPFLTSKP